MQIKDSGYIGRSYEGRNWLNILITHVYSRDNNGDAAILSVLIGELRRVIPNARIVVSTMEDVEAFPDFQGVRQIASPILTAFSKQRNIASNTFHVARSVLLSALWPMGFRFRSRLWSWMALPAERLFLDELQRADIVVPVGGGYLLSPERGIYEFVRLVLLLQPLYVANKIGKTVVLYAQSIGPFVTRPQRFIAGRILRGCSYINVREEMSLATLKLLRIQDPDTFQLASDPAFLLDNYIAPENLPREIAKRLKANKQKLVGITARRWLKGEEYGQYIEDMARAADQIIEEHKLQIVFIPQVSVTALNDDDRVVQSEIYRLMRHQESAFLIEEKLTYGQSYHIFQQLDYLIGTRFHSVIFALTANVPSIAIGYEYKTEGIMKGFNLSNWVIPIQEVTTNKIVDLFSQLVHERSQYLKQIETALPLHRRLARLATESIVRSVPNRSDKVQGTIHNTRNALSD